MSFPALAERTTLLLNSKFKRIWELTRQLKNPINLGVGEPNFDVPEPLKEAAIQAIRDGRNGYTLPAGIQELKTKINTRLDRETGRQKEAFVACGTNGALTLALQTLVNPGDEVIIFDPYFVAYPQLVHLVEGRTIFIETYPEFQPDPDRVAAAITPRTKAIILCSPGNPTGIVTASERVKALAELADRRGLWLISDEIYASFVYGEDAFVSPARYGENVIVCSSFSKTHAMTGWRLGYAYGPAPVIQAMVAVQQATFVCAPHMAQVAGVAAWDYPMTKYVDEYRKKRDWLLRELDPRYEIVKPGGAFYLFPRVPTGTGTQLAEAAIGEQLVIMPGNVFSQHDTHFRISYGVDDLVLEQGVAILNRLAKRG
jgi:aspartate/methionine/tyrosine aminotransferase